MKSGPNTLKIDLSALVHNLSVTRRMIGQGTRIMGIVKSDAYGHGMVTISKALEENNIDCLGVAYTDEAIELRNREIGLPIIVLCGMQTEKEVREVVEHGLIPVLFDLKTVHALDREGRRQGKKSPMYLKVDTGMGRLGISCREVGPFVEAARSLENVEIKGMISHLSAADDPSDDFTDEQIRAFQDAINTAKSFGLDMLSNSIANSAGIMDQKGTHLPMVRPGIMLYGGLPSPGFMPPYILRPVMHFRGRILQVRDLPDHTPVSYGKTHYTKGVRRTAVLSAGYGHGLPRSMSNRGYVLIGGKKAQIIGRICMDITICDVTGIDGVKAGDEAVFLGSQGEETITGDEIAGWAGTISYEVFCSIGRQNRKEYSI